MKRLLPFLLLLWLPFGAAAQTIDQRFVEVQDFFAKFVFAEQVYDPALADFYADSAQLTVIELRNNQRYKTTMDGATYKQFLASYQPTVAQLGEYFTYTNVTISDEGDAFRILATRSSHLKGYAFPYMARVAQRPGGGWQIVEELTMVQP